MTTECAPTAIAVRPRLPTARSLSRLQPNHAAARMLALTALSAAMLPFGTIGVAAAVCVLVGMVAAAPLRRLYAELAVARAHHARYVARDESIPRGSAAWFSLAELTMLVDHIERNNDELAKRLELQTLLDRFVTLSIAHQRALGAMAMSDRVQLSRMLDELRLDQKADPRRIDVCERRLRSHDHCEATAERIADEIGIIEQFIRLVAQRVECPEIPSFDDAVDHQLAQLDGDDAARIQLATILD